MSDEGNHWHLWVVGLHWGLTVSWERVFEPLAVTVLGGRSGMEEVKLIRDLWAGVCSLIWKWSDCAFSSSLGELRPLILHLQSVNRV